MNILAIDTSCDETSAAVTSGHRVLSNVVYSQWQMHREWGGVVPNLARRAHEERIVPVCDEALRKAGMTMNDIDAVAVTQGPGLAIALEVGIRHAKMLSEQYAKPLIAANHLEGHLYSPYVQNSHGNPPRSMKFPIIGVLISGAHTELVLWNDHLSYNVVGSTVDDAAGEALDKAARLLGFGYPGGAVIERLASDVNNEDRYKFTRPMWKTPDYNMSFSGLKTAHLYLVRQMTPQHLDRERPYLASSFQEAVFDTILHKLDRLLKSGDYRSIACGGGVVSNMYLRQKMRAMARSHEAHVYFPSYKYLTGDNAAMIGVAAYYRALQGLYVKDKDALDRMPRMSL